MNINFSELLKEAIEILVKFHVHLMSSSVSLNLLFWPTSAVSGQMFLKRSEKLSFAQNGSQKGMILLKKPDICLLRTSHL